MQTEIPDRCVEMVAVVLCDLLMTWVFIKSTYHFLASDGEHEAEMETGSNIINLKMKDVSGYKEDGRHFYCGYRFTTLYKICRRCNGYGCCKRRNGNPVQ